MTKRTNAGVAPTAEQAAYVGGSFVVIDVKMNCRRWIGGSADGAPASLLSECFVVPTHRQAEHSADTPVANFCPVGHAPLGIVSGMRLRVFGASLGLVSVDANSAVGSTGASKFLNRFHRLASRTTLFGAYRSRMMPISCSDSCLVAFLANVFWAGVELARRLLGAANPANVFHVAYYRALG